MARRDEPIARGRLTDGDLATLSAFASQQRDAAPGSARPLAAAPSA